MLKEVANLNFIEGVTHLGDWLPPGSSFDDGPIGTPFLRGQRWWKSIPEFNKYVAHLTYLLERGESVSDILWSTYLPSGFKYDYCNPDILLNRLTVKNGKIAAPEGLSYRLIWLPDNKRMLPETLERLLELARNGATIVGNHQKESLP